MKNPVLKRDSYLPPFLDLRSLAHQVQTANPERDPII